MNKMFMVILVGALTLIGCNNIKQGDAKGPPPPAMEDPRLAPAPMRIVTVSPARTPAPVPVQAPVSTDVVAGSKVYILKKGDTLSKIAREQFGGLSHLHDLINANPGIDHNNLLPGQQINLP